MKLLDEEEIKRKREQTKKTKKMIIIAIIVLLILCVAIVSLLFYREYNPSKITTYIDNVEVPNFDSILDIQEDTIYVPIKEFATYINSGYKSYNGDYSRKSEDENMCYVINEKYEVAIFTEKSKIIYKQNLQNKTADYEYCYTNNSVFSSNGKLYASEDGIEQGYNVNFQYDKKNKIIKISTLNWLQQKYAKDLETNMKKISSLGQYNKVELDKNNFNNWKAIFDNMLIVVADGKYGVLDRNNFTWILEPKYDKIEYIQYSSDFFIHSNNKVGIMSKEGKTKVQPVYDELTLMDRNLNLYRIKKDNLYGVIDDNEKLLIHPENEQIGIDIAGFTYNGIKNGYILMNTFIPVRQEKKWAFYNTEGRMITDGFIYDKIGCKISNGNNVYSLLEITGYDVMVVGQDNKYTVINKAGEELFAMVLDDVYMKISSGETSYYMTHNEKKLDVIEKLEKIGIKRAEQNN